MCGIGGFVAPFGQDRLAGMTETMHHRGPDETGYHFARCAAGDRNLGLGHKRLSIIDLASGQQPMHSDDGMLAVVFNGEIYSFRELRRTLEAAGHRFRTTSDTEVILRGYEHFGEAVVDRLDGMFAFGIWDARRERLFLARDRFGIKPLYYWRSAGGDFAFASEIKALLALGVEARPNREALYHYLLYSWISSKETIFQGIFQLPPGHCMTWCRGAVEVRRYWQLEKTGQQRSPEDWAERIRESLKAAVRSHLVADVPVGITLSGGLDSSAVLALMAECVEPAQIQAFTIGFGLLDDELPFARQAAAHVSVKAAERLVAPEQIAEVFPRIVWHLEEPLAHPVLGTTWFLAQFVREHVKVALIGEGSDELFAGYPHYRLFGLPYSLAPRPVLRRYFLAVANLMPEAATLCGLLAPEMLDRELLSHVAHTYDRYFRSGSMAEGGLCYELENELVYNQLARIDKLTMAHSVEARVPFLDRAFAELAYQVPFRLKCGRGVQKQILRQAMCKDLPQEVLYRPKSGPKGTQALLPTLLHQVLRKQLDSLLSPATTARRGWFRPQAVADYLGRARSLLVRRHPIESRRRAKFALALATLEQWAQLFLDESRPGVPHARTRARQYRSVS